MRNGSVRSNVFFEKEVNFSLEYWRSILLCIWKHTCNKGVFLSFLQIRWPIEPKSAQVCYFMHYVGILCIWQLPNVLQSVVSCLMSKITQNTIISFPFWTEWSRGIQRCISPRGKKYNRNKTRESIIRIVYCNTPLQNGRHCVSCNFKWSTTIRSV